MNTVVQITIKDGLLLPSGFIAPASYSCVIFCRVPADWVANGCLKADKLETFYESLYGKNWRAGNEDGSRYVVLNTESRVLGEADSASWQNAAKNKDYQYWFYRISDTGEPENVQPSEL